MIRFQRSSCLAFVWLVTLIPSGGQSPESKTDPAQFAVVEHPFPIPFSPAAADPAPLQALQPKPATGPASLFDAVAGRMTRVTTTIEVNADPVAIDSASPQPFRAGGQDVLTSAGTFGDISRYLQLFPGVVGTSDFSNQMLVRGGHPMENLFLVDGMEVPNINHLSNANTTGGFGPMIDAAAIQSVQFYSGGFDAIYPERLSSVTEFHTLDVLPGVAHSELDLGIQGVGGLFERARPAGDLLFSAHHGLVNLVSQNVGIGGVPSYTNALTRFRRRTASGGALTLLNLAGIDSIAITPCASDPDETSTIDSTYRGGRETTGAEWEHVYSPHLFGVLNVSDSEELEHVHEDDQILNPLFVSNVRHACPIPGNYVQTSPVYREDSNNAFTAAKYNLESGGSGITLTAGSAFWLRRPQFAVNQPAGAYSPYLPTMTRADSASFRSNFMTAESGTYAQALFHPAKALSLSAGGRLQTFAFGSHFSLTPRLNVGYRLGERAGLHVGYAEYAQLPPYAYLLAYPENHALAPMRATHEVAGLDVAFSSCLQLRAEAYAKNYRAIPASTEYPAVTLHTMVDMIGEQSVWLPMTTGGRGAASGIELSGLGRIGTRFQWQGSGAYSRARFAGLDGVFHPSNFDLPWIVNAAGVDRLGRGMTVSARYGYASGRPYTPFNMAASLAQNRPVYDLSQINVPRAPYYSRLDAQLNKEIRLETKLLELYCGVDNILNRSNWLSYAWMPRYETHSKVGVPVGTLWQTPIFPNFGLRLIMR